MERKESITRRNVLAVSDVNLNSYHTETTTLFCPDFVDVEEKCSADFGLSDGIRTIDLNTVMSKGEERMSSKSGRLSLKYISFPNDSRSSQSSSVSSPLEAQYRSQKESEDAEFINLQKAVDNDNDVDVDTSISSSSSSTPSGKWLTIYD